VSGTAAKRIRKSTENLATATEFLHTVLPELQEGEEYCCEAWPSPKPFRRGFDAIEPLAEYMVKNGKTSNAYFSPIVFRTELGRKKDAAARVRVVWSDLDCGSGKSFKTRNDALAKIRKFPLKPQLIISSGRGFHVYWILADDVASGQFDRLMAIVKGVARRLGGDPAACLETQLLRVPGTLNIDSVDEKKDGLNYRVTVVEYNRDEPAYSLEDFEQEGVVSPFVSIRERESVSRQEWDGSTAKIEPILERCRWMRHCRDDAVALPEPDWYAMLGIVGRCEDGAKLAHDLSRPHRNYDMEETGDKLEHALESAGPRTCADIQLSLGGGPYCRACPLRGRITSPIVLGLPDEPDPAAASSADAQTFETPPYPVVVLPDPVRSFVEEGAEAMGVPPEFIAMHLLTFAGTVLGRNVEIVVKRGSWVERPILWTALVADAGSTKSPALTAAKRGTAALQREATRVYLRAYEQYEQELAKWLAVAPKQRGEKPAEPRMRHFFTTDATPEALAPMLLTSSGIAIIADELLGWTRGMDAYKSGKGKERQGHLELWSGDSLKIDRKGGRPILVEQPVVGVLGGIQPQALVELSGEIARADGFLPRFLWSFPEPMKTYWDDADISEEANRRIELLFEQLGRLEGTFGFSGEAKLAWVDWYNRNEDLKAEEAGLMKAVASKLPRQLARLALILHCLRYPTAQTFELDADTVNAAIQLVEYHRAHARKAFTCLRGPGGGSAQGLQERILHALEVSSVSSGTHAEGTNMSTLPSMWLSRTDLHKALGNSVRSEDLTRVVEHLVREGLVERRRVLHGPRGGRPGDEFRLRAPEETEETEETSRHVA
jgi:hypothetical protein